MRILVNGKNSNQPTCNALPHSPVIYRPWDKACIIMDVVGANGKGQHCEDVIPHEINQQRALAL